MLKNHKPGLMSYNKGVLIPVSVRVRVRVMVWVRVRVSIRTNGGRMYVPPLFPGYE